MEYVVDRHLNVQIDRETETPGTDEGSPETGRQLSPGPGLQATVDLDLDSTADAGIGLSVAI
jgi:hypothetical protein